jgi:hypothetical protein
VHVGNEKFIQTFTQKREGDRPLGRPNIDGRIIIKYVRLQWINLAQDRVQWQALVKTAKNLRIP